MSNSLCEELSHCRESRHCRADGNPDLKENKPTRIKSHCRAGGNPVNDMSNSFFKKILQKIPALLYQPGKQRAFVQRNWLTPVYPVIP